MAKIIIIGLDGVPLNLIENFVAKGYLPTFKKLMSKSAHGTLKSTTPPITAPAWASFATGLDPGEHGCYNFIYPKDSLSDLAPLNNRRIKSKTFYEILVEKGKKCILINMPMSYPPRINGIVITSLLTASDNFVYPRRLKLEIPEFKDYRLTPNASLMIKEDYENYAKDIINLEAVRFKCAQKLFAKDWDFFFILFSGTDWIQHLIYDKLINNKLSKTSNAIKLYKNIDSYIAWFLENAPKNTKVIIMSDHGFDYYDKSFNVNNWLAEQGYLELEEGNTEEHGGLAKEISKAREQRRKMKLPFFIESLLKYNWVKNIAHHLYKKTKKYLNVEIETKKLKPNLTKSRAYNAHFYIDGGVYINDKKRFKDGTVSEQEYETLREEIIAKLRKLSIIKSVHKKEELYKGSDLKEAPDIIIKMQSKVKANNTLDNTVISNVKTNGHSHDGIIFIYGEKGQIEMNISDLSSKILNHLLKN